MFEALTGPELPTVLIVDDERLNRSMLAELLSPHYRVLLAKDGPGALVIAQRLYGDPARMEERAAEIVARNKVPHPGFVPGGAALQVLSAEAANG